jgi:hypothetical protein
MKAICASVNLDLFMVLPRPTARIAHAAKLEFSSKDRSENREAGHGRCASVAGEAGRRSAAGHAANAGTNTFGAGGLYPIEATPSLHQPTGAILILIVARFSA